jgi:hypothetical protein
MSDHSYQRKPSLTRRIRRTRSLTGQGKAKALDLLTAARGGLRANVRDEDMPRLNRIFAALESIQSSAHQDCRTSKKEIFKTPALIYQPGTARSGAGRPVG